MEQKMRIIKQEDLNFNISVYPSCRDPADVIDDKEHLSRIEDRLEDGDNLAWLLISVSIFAAGFTGVDSLGGVSLPIMCAKELHIRLDVDEHDMFKVAAQNLIEEILKNGWQAKLASFTVPKKIDIDWR